MRSRTVSGMSRTGAACFGSRRSSSPACCSPPIEDRCGPLLLAGVCGAGGRRDLGGRTASSRSSSLPSPTSRRGTFRDAGAYERISQADLTVCRATEPLAVGFACAIEVDRVMPGAGDGGVETAKLFFERCAVLGPYRSAKLLEQRSESSHHQHRGCAELTNLGEPERHEVLPADEHS